MSPPPRAPLPAVGRRGLFVGWLAIAALLVFALPWAHPPSRRILSESYVLGFDNRLAIAGALFAFGLLALGRWRWGSAPPVAGRVESEAEWDPGGGPGRRAIAVMGLLYALATAAFYLLVPGVYFTESSYFLRRVDAMLRYGLAPYSGFEFAYGPGLLAVPAALTGALRGLGMAPLPSLKAGYYLFFLLLGLAGLVALAALLRRSRGSARARTTAFVLIALATFDLGLGANYGALRFLLPYVGLLWLDRAGTAGGDGGPGAAWRGARFAGRDLLLTLGALALSPEIGIATAVAVLVWIAARLALGGERRSGLSGVSLLAGWLASKAAIAALLASGPASLFAAFGSFASGAHHLPVWPTPSIVLYLGALCWVVSDQLLLARAEPARAPLYLGLASISLGLLPGALGRADPTHALYYGVAVLAWALLAAGAGDARRRRLAIGAFGLVFVLLYQGVTLYQQRGTLLANAYLSGCRRWVPPGRAVELARRAGLDPERVRRFLGRLEESGTDRVGADLRSEISVRSAAGARLATPLGGREPVEWQLKDQDAFVPEYFLDDLNLATEEQLARKRADLLAQAEALVPADTLAAPRGTYGRDPAEIESFLRLRLLFPLRYRPRRAPWSPREEIRELLRERYEPVAGGEDWAILRRRG